MERSRIGKMIEPFVDEEDKLIILDLLDDFRKDVDNVGYEWCTAQSIDGFIESPYTDRKYDEVLLTDKLLEEGLSNGLHTVIHNHIYGSVPFPSPEDFETFIDYNVKYGIVTNEFGIFVIKNNNYNINLTSDEESNIQNAAINIKKKMEKDFQIDNPQYMGILEKDKDDKYYREVNDFVKQNYGKYESLYRDCLFNHNVEVKFIRTK